MNRKISKIKLDNFRAFKNKDLSFNEGLDVSNLVVLYAPNGYGKTSIFDAIEWSLSGKISRISENRSIKEIANSEKGNILKNTDTDAEYGQVEIGFSDNTSYVVRTKKINKNRKTDYKPGEILREVDITEENREKIVLDNLLTHDQIDAILTSKSAEERYEAFEKLWDKNDVSKNYRELNIGYKRIESKKKDTQRKIDEKENEITKIENEISRLVDTELLEKISEVNKLVYNNFLVLPENLNQLEIDIISRSSELSEDIKKNDLKIQVSSRITDYLKNTETFNELKRKLEVCRKTIARFEKMHSYKRDKKNQLSNLNELLICKKKIEYLVKYKDRYRNTLSDIEEKQRKNDYLIGIKAELEQKKAKLRVEKNKIESDVIRNDLQILELNNRLKKLGDMERVPEIDKQITELNDIITEIEGRNKGLEERKTNYIQIISKLNFIKKRPLERTRIESLDNSLSIKNNLKILVEDIIKDDVELREINDLLDDWEKKSNLLAQVKELGLKIINNEKSTHCPLCNNKYETFEKLLANAQEEYEPDYKFRQLQGRRNEVEKRKEKKYVKFIEKLDQMLDYYNNKVLGLSKVIEKNSGVILSKKKLCEDYEEQIADLRNELNEILSVSSLKEIREQEENELQNKLINRKELGKKNSIVEEKILKIETEYKNNDELMKINNLQKSNIEGQKEYLEYKEKKDGYDIDNLEYELKLVRNKIDDLKLNVRQMDLRIEEISNGLVNNDEIAEKRREEELIKKLNNCKQELIEVEKLFILAFSDSIDNMSDYDLDKEKYINYRVNFEKAQQLLKQVEEIVKRLKDKNQLELKKDELLVLQSDARKIAKAFEIIKDEREKTAKYIEMSISRELNLDVMNRIFKIMEPHGEWKELSFKIKAEDKLEMDFICKNDEDKEEAPALYLSSAQINMLSLSLFLAKAISSEDREIDTVFIDDPIEYFDTLNELTFIDLLRIICFTLNIQVIISTHDSRFFDLCRSKLSSEYYSAQYIDLMDE